MSRIELPLTNGCLESWLEDCLKYGTIPEDFEEVAFTALLREVLAARESQETPTKGVTEKELNKIFDDWLHDDAGPVYEGTYIEDLCKEAALLGYRLAGGTFEGKP